MSGPPTTGPSRFLGRATFRAGKATQHTRGRGGVGEGEQYRHRATNTRGSLRNKFARAEGHGGGGRRDAVAAAATVGW